jgi:diguanylate cyclase (GGDEF)-like protein/PAS domain S-box-containing protein
LKYSNNNNRGLISGVTAVTTTIAVVCVISLILSYFALSLQAGVRGYITGEANWSKNQYTAVSALIRYAETGNAHYHTQFLTAMEVPLGDRLARLELMKEHYSYEIARNSFLQGNVHPDDIWIMIALFRCCHSYPPLKDVVILWEQGDAGLQQLLVLAQDIHKDISNGKLNSSKAKDKVQEIEGLDKKIRILASQFTEELADAARSISNIIFFLISAVTSVVFFLAVWFSRETFRKFQKTETQYRMLLDQANDAVILTEKNTDKILDFNLRAEKLFKVTADKILNVDYKYFLSISNYLNSGYDFKQATAHGKIIQDGTHVEISSNTVEWQTGTAQLHIIRNITERLAAEQQLQIAYSALANLAEGVMILDNHLCVISVNRAFRKITGYEESEVIGKHPPMPHFRKSDLRTYAAILQTLKKTGVWRGELLNRRKNGEYYSELHRASCVRDEDGKITHFVCVFNDNTAVRENERKLQFLAQCDSLTQLLNRSKFEEMVIETLKLVKKIDSKAALLFIDLDNFKTINDTFGHAVGDQYIKTMSSRISNTVRTTDIVGRVGGDEFAVLLNDVHTRSDVVAVATKLRNAIAQHVDVQGSEISGSASVGLCLYPDDAKNVEDLFVYADAAMYEAKRRGRNNLQWFTQELMSAVETKLILVSGLRTAGQRGQLELHYQPCVDLSTGTVRGLEALLRWTHPDFGRVSPGVFIPLAEEFGVIDSLTDFVLREACRQGRVWMDAGIKPVPVSVNLSPRNFWDAELPQKIASILDESGWPARYLRLEITESTIMGGKNPGAVMQQLRELGLSLSIDDFGVGHSSLSSLQNFPVQCMKIDLSFVRGIPENKTNLNIIKTIISLAEHLELDLIAEGIETQAQADVLLQEGCRQGQGYFFCKPAPAMEMETYLRDNERKNILPLLIGESQDEHAQRRKRTP